MNFIRKSLAFLSVIIIVLLLLYMDFSDLSWSANGNNYLGLAACALNIWANLFLLKGKK